MCATCPPHLSLSGHWTLSLIYVSCIVTIIINVSTYPPYVHCFFNHLPIFLYIFCLSSLSTDLSPSIILYRDSLAVTKASKQTVHKVRVKEAGAEACGWAVAVSTGHDDVATPGCSLEASIEEELTATPFKPFTLAFL